MPYQPEFLSDITKKTTTVHVDANVIYMYGRYQLYPLIVSEKKEFEKFYEILTFAPLLQLIQLIDLEKII